MHDQEPNRAFDALRDAQFVVLTTYRRSGVAVPTTVWFAEAGGRLYVTTNRASGKAKRITSDGRVHVAPSDAMGNVHGPAVAGRARILASEEFACAVEVLQGKYGQQYTDTVARMDAIQAPGSRIFIEVLPESDTHGP